jgi:hypothetical protein
MTEQDLKDQYNQLLNNQKNKLLALKQKKLGQSSGQNKNESKGHTSQFNNKFGDDDDDDNDENDLGLTNNIFTKFDRMESMDSDSEQETHVQKNITKNPEVKKGDSSKILIKKTAPNVKKNEKISSYALDESESMADKVRELKDENGRFRKLLMEKDYEIGHMKKKLDNEQALQGLGPISGDAAATKIVELAKKVR